MKNLLFFFLYTVPLFCCGATFKVTSNASAGPGSLAEAVQLATINGSATTDYIEFNLPPAQTTISITGPIILPSNLVIDGTTQPGRTFGISNAKVHLKASGCTIGFVVKNASNIEVYGFWFSGFNGLPNCNAAAISIVNVQQFTLGKPNKGNCFSNNLISIINPWVAGEQSESVDLFIQSNRFGMDTLTTPDYLSTTIQFGAVRRFYFGGNQQAEGNRVGNGFVSTGNPLVPLANSGDSIIIKNNAFAFDAFNGDLSSRVGMRIQGDEISHATLHVSIANNKIGLDDAIDKVTVAGVKGNISIRNNYIGSLNTAVNPGQLVAGVLLSNCIKEDSICVANNTINGYEQGIKLVNTIGTTLSTNSIYCNKKGIQYSAYTNVPLIRLQQVTATTLRGTTTPGSKVELFGNVSCSALCENGKNVVATIQADNTGAFNYSGVVPQQYSLTATDPFGTTSEFYGPKFSVIDLKVKNATCGVNNGSISGVKLLVASSFYWENAEGKNVGTDTILQGLPIGEYRLVVKDSFSACPVYSSFYTIKNIGKPVVQNIGFAVSNTNCNMPAGKLVLEGEKSPASESVWQNSRFETLLLGRDSIESLLAGSYYYRVCLIEDSTCYSQYGPVAVADVAGPQINFSQVKVTSADCNISNGAIENITINNGYAQAFYRWEDSTGKLIGNTPDIKGLASGWYRLKYKDASACDTLVSPFFTIEARGGLVIDSSSLVIRATGCTVVNGCILNLQVKDATLYDWKDLNTGQSVANTSNLLNVQEGSYKLYVSNSLGCKDSSHVLTIPRSTFQPISYNTLDLQQPHCARSNGFAIPGSFSTDTLLYTFSWHDSIAKTLVGSHTRLVAMNAGSYFLNATDTNGCSGKVLSVQFTQSGMPVLDVASVRINNDTCTQQTGSIQNIQVSGGKAPYAWIWYGNNPGTQIAATASQLTKLGEGSYYAVVKDAYDCSIVSAPFTISNLLLKPAAPLADNLYILRNTLGDINIKNHSPGTYYLYDSLTASIPISTSTQRNIKTPIVRYDKTFYLQHTVGSCQGDKVAVTVRVFDESKISLPNAFSPNGDGINDTWKMQVQGTMFVKEWVVFNRFGQQVFVANNAAAVWDGTLKNTQVPVGTYYWVVLATDREGKQQRLSGSVLVLK